jgi:DMSO/TMAO reductase YedYZ molybdopterin-dependent catalytic subunit
MDKQKRRFLKLMGKGFVVFGSGLIGIPLGACQRDPEYQELADLGPDLLTDARVEEMTESEVEAFVAEVDARAAEVLGDSAADTPAPDDTGEDSEGAEDTTGLDAEGTEVDGLPEIPPGQHVVESLPVLGGNPTPRSIEEWGFYVKGEVDQELQFNWDEFTALDQVEQTIDHHCVTGWTMLNLPTRGVPISALLALAGLTDKAKHVVFDCEHGYTTNVTVADALSDQVQIELQMWGEPLQQKYGGPARGRVPHLYGYKSGKWVIGLRVLETDEPGFWEKLGYSNTADPWTEDRYS